MNCIPPYERAHFAPGNRLPTTQPSHSTQSHQSIPDHRLDAAGRSRGLGQVVVAGDRSFPVSSPRFLSPAPVSCLNPHEPPAPPRPAPTHPRCPTSSRPAPTHHRPGRWWVRWCTAALGSATPPNRVVGLPSCLEPGGRSSPNRFGEDVPRPRTGSGRIPGVFGGWILPGSLRESADAPRTGLGS